MRRKSARTSGKQSPEKGKQLDSPARRTRRTSKRRKKSTSESENSEDEQEVVQTTEKETSQVDSNAERVSIDPENKDNIVDKESDAQERTMEKQDKKIRLKRNNRSIAANDGNETTHQEERRRSRRRGSPKIEERKHQEDDDGDKKGKGKSKGKTKSAKIEKSQPPDESDTHNESEISTNAQVTPQSPQIVNTNLMVDNDEIDVAEKNAEDKKSCEVECKEEEEVREAGDEDTKDKLVHEVHHDKSENPTNEIIVETAIESENIDVKTATEVVESNKSKSNEEVNCYDTSNAKPDESLKNSKEIEAETSAVNEEPEKVTTGDLETDKGIEATQQTTEAIENAETSEKVEITENAETTENAEISEDAEATENAERAETTETTENAETTENVETIENVEITENVETTQSAATAENAETTQSAATAENAETTQSVSIAENAETIERETQEETVRSDEDFTGFAKDKKQETTEEKQVVDEPMDISIDVSFTLKDTSVSITEAEESTEEIRPEPTIPEPGSNDDTTTTKPPHERLRTKSTTNRKITIRRNSRIDSEVVTRDKNWGSGMTFLNRFTPVRVDTDVIQGIYANVRLLDESEVKLDIEVKDRRKSVTETKDRKRLERLSSNESEVRNHENEEKEQEEDNANIIAMNRKISIVDDSASKLKPPPSPAKNPISSILFITNLVRPFTLKQLRELLERTGKIKENGFWTDRIKSKCYVHYDKMEDAEATRNALHGVHWPIGNGKKLMIDYGAEEDLENARNPPVTPPLPEIPVKVEKENQQPIKKPQEEEEERKKEKLKEKRRHEHVREWDVGKTETHGSGRTRSRSRSRDRTDKRKRSRHTPSPFDDYLTRKQKKSEDQAPQKLMDDLFQKTKTTPSIYWQPLTPEEIQTKQQQRLERMAEHKRRMEESSRGRADFGRGGPYRRRYD